MREIYAMQFVPAEEDGIRVTCRDLPGLLTFGDDDAEATELAADALATLIGHLIAEGEDLPMPTPPQPGERLIELPPSLAVKAAVHRAWRATGYSKSDLARQLSISVDDVERILDPHHSTRLDRMVEAARVLGVRLSIEATPTAA
ncbi:type II toxin-antitoxin system HicB family antitoxin [Methyloraptor flagellatus]|jgi:antitoxin HicB|uniref:Type II toxin-antitoxin system HicB family antitoxin n=1 Tax=Methyloraptor flagellatus TaxID=3162530 RepID=A0AAU7X8V7_9HYPH